MSGRGATLMAVSVGLDASILQPLGNDDMAKLYTIVGVLALAGCATKAVDTTVTSVAATTRDEAALTDASAPAKIVDMAALDNEEQCTDLTRPGSRIVVARRCEPIDEEALVHTLNQVRRDQEMLDRLAREKEGRRGGF